MPRPGGYSAILQLPAEERDVDDDDDEDDALPGDPRSLELGAAGSLGSCSWRGAGQDRRAQRLSAMALLRPVGLVLLLVGAMAAMCGVLVRSPGALGGGGVGGGGAAGSSDGASQRASAPEVRSGRTLLVGEDGGRVASAVATSGAKACPGSVELRGHPSSLSLVSAAELLPSLPAGVAEIRDGALVPHLGSRTYMADRCAPGAYDRSEYAELRLLGRRLRYTVDVANAGCGCSASLYLTGMRRNLQESSCGDYYCDANKTCGTSCAEVLVQSSNRFAFRSLIQLAGDHDGRGGWAGDDYGPGAGCIDTMRPFEVAASFPVDEEGILMYMEVVLTQPNSSCMLTARIDRYNHHGRDGFLELTVALSNGLTPVVSYLTAGRQCAPGESAVCSDSVAFSDFSVEDLATAGGGEAGEASAAPPGALNTTAAAPTTASPSPTMTTTRTTTTTAAVSLFCFSVMQASTYELDLVKLQLSNHTSIFACEDWAVFSENGGLYLGTTTSGDAALTLPIPVVSREGMGNTAVAGTTTNSWLNTMTFLGTWDALVQDGRFRAHDWVVKVDPDAVFFPTRLRWRLEPRTEHGANASAWYVHNCRRFSDIQLLGSMEVLSREAVETYSSGVLRCKSELAWQGWGEDYFLQHCLDLLMVPSFEDLGMLADRNCGFVGPCGTPANSLVAAFHPFKSAATYRECVDQAIPPTTAAPPPSPLPQRAAGAPSAALVPSISV